MWARQGIGARAEFSEALFQARLESVTVSKGFRVSLLVTYGKEGALGRQPTGLLDADREEVGWGSDQLL